MAEKEIWKKIPEWDEYEVSSLGRVKRGEYIISSKNCGAYAGVSLWKNNVGTTKHVHRLVAGTFLPNPKELEQVNHLNGDKKDNRVSNLEWVSRSENTKHAIRTGLMKPSKLSKRIAKMNVETQEIIEIYSNMSEASRENHMNRQTIERKCWNTDGNQEFKFIDEEEEKSILPDISDWKVIKNYPDYLISCKGDIFSTKTNHLIATHIVSGYENARLLNNEKRGNHKVHRLVAEAYIDNPFNLPIVNHKNGLKTDNNVENLEWVTYSGNSQHAVNTKLIDNTRSVRQVDIQNNKVVAEYNSIVEAAKATEISRKRIQDCAAGRRPTTNGFRWEYTNERKVKRQKVEPPDL